MFPPIIWGVVRWDPNYGSQRLARNRTAGPTWSWSLKLLPAGTER